MKKSNLVWIGVAVVIVAVAAYLVFHKSSGPTYGSSTKSNTSSSQSKAPAVNNAVLKTKQDATVGQYLTDPSGKALYTYNSDSNGVSNCTGACLANWPAYQAASTSSSLPTGVSTIKRTDNGQTQYTYNGMPLYYFVGDSAGKVTGNGVENFTVAKPAAASSSSSSAGSSSSSSSSSSDSSNSSPNYPY